ncbi:MAG: AAA family ATPase, partial [Desulfovibrio sp.]|nr:AAA family ATPase [Desulfovibrio sp.]
MYIESFRIDGFGIYNGVTVPQLPPGMSIFLGENEAGKSTCLEFLRTMLTGYPAGRRAARDTSPLRGGEAGGGLVLRAGPKRLILTRRPGTGDGILSLHEDGGAMVDAAVLQQLLSHVSREVYCAVFGFSLLELAALDSLDAEDVRNALYSASFGAGLRSPGEAMSLIEARMETLFRKRSGR